MLAGWPAVRAVLRGAVHAVDLIVRRQMLARQRGAEVRIPLLHALQHRRAEIRRMTPVRPPAAQPMLQPNRPCAFEFLNGEDPNRRDLAADTIGCLMGYAHLANTRSLALVGDPVEMEYYILFSFSSPAEKKRCLDLIRSNDDLGREYIENDLVQPTEEEIRDARPPIYVSRGLFMVNPRVLLCAAIPLLMLVQFSPAQSSQDQGTPTLRVDSNLVFLDVTVLDKKGIPVVKGLTRDVVRHPDTRTVEFTAALKTNNLNFIPSADGKFTLGIIAAAASLNRSRDILASRMREETLVTSTTDPKLLPEVATRISFADPVPRRTTTLRVAVEDQDRGRVGTAEIDGKLIQNAPQAPTPNPTLHPGSNRPASSAP